MKKIILIFGIFLLNLAGFSQRTYYQTDADLFSAWFQRDIAEVGSYPLVIMENLNAINTKPTLQISNLGNGACILVDTADVATSAAVSIGFETINYGFYRNLNTMYWTINGGDVISVGTGDVSIDGDVEMLGDLTAGTFNGVTVSEVANTVELTKGTSHVALTAGSTLDVDGATDISGNLVVNNNFTVGTTNAGTLDFTAASKTLNVENNATVDQDLTQDAAVTFGTVTSSGKIYAGVDVTQAIYIPEQATNFTGTMIVGNGGGSLSHTGTTEGFYNTFIGIDGGNDNTTGEGNIAIGYESLTNNTTGGYNIGIGASSLYTGTATYYNVAIGYGALYYATASYNVAIGYNALNKNTSGLHNTAIGSYSSDAVTTGARNTAIGSNSLSKLTTGDYNTAIGYKALEASTTEDNNTAIGYEAFKIATGFTNSTAIGYQTEPDASNQIMLGDANVTQVKTAGSYMANLGIYSAEITTPTPIANYGAIYPKADNHLYFQDGAGTEKILTEGSSDYGEMGNVYGSSATEVINSVSEWHGMCHANITGSAPHLNSGFSFVVGKLGSGNITTAQGGAAINIADVAHGLLDNDFVTVQSANHVGVGTVVYVDADNFEVDITYVGDEASTWQMGSYLLVATADIYFSVWNASFTQSDNATRTSIVTPYINTTICTKPTSRRALDNNTDEGSIGGNELISVSAGDRYWFACQSSDPQTLTFTVRNVSIK
jgi:hypothetical protein